MEEALVEWLLADTAITALVERRINWSERPQTTALPALVLHRITGVRDFHMQGPSGLVRSVVQADCWGRTHKEAVNLSRSVRARLNGIGRNDIASFQSVQLQNERQTFETGAGAAERYYRTSLDFELWHSE